MDADGRDLIAKVFGHSEKNGKITKAPVLSINPLLNQSDRDEQEDFKLIFMGTIQGIRNPKAHETTPIEDPFQALEYLIFLSLLARRAEDI